MSQRGSAPRPASRRSSRSPAKHEEGSPRQHVRLPRGHDARPSSTSRATTEGGGWSQNLPVKALGVHNILNPSEPRLLASEGAGLLSSRPRESEAAPAAASAWTHSGSRLYYSGHGQRGPGSHPGTPVGNVAQLGKPPSSGRNSPITPYPFPALKDSRNVASPKLPQASSLTRGVPLREAGPQPPSVASGSSPAKRPYETEALKEIRSLPGLHQVPGRAPAANLLLATPPRGMAQPMARPTDAPYVPPPLAIPHGRRQSFHQFQDEAANSRPPAAIGGPREGSTSWTDVIRRSGVTGAMAGGDGQQAFMALPGSDTPIPVQVDYSQASKKADEKRQRNAKASTRHRRKNKTMQEENLRQLQDLRDERQQMAEEMGYIKRQRDFYRDERNRLRDVVARTPGLHQHAAGPPSPAARSAESHAERGPGTNTQITTPTQGYASDSSSGERPAQRRRTEDYLDFSMPALGASGGGPPAVPVLQPGGQTYGGPPRPLSAASSGSGERLPPLRVMERPPAIQSLRPGQPREQDPGTAQWRLAQPRQYETGWATASRKPNEGHAPHWQ